MTDKIYVQLNDENLTALKEINIDVSKRFIKQYPGSSCAEYRFTKEELEHYVSTIPSDNHSYRSFEFALEKEKDKFYDAHFSDWLSQQMFEEVTEFIMEQGGWTWFDEDCFEDEEITIEDARESNKILIKELQEYLDNPKKGKYGGRYFIKLAIEILQDADQTQY